MNKIVIAAYLFLVFHGISYSQHVVENGTSILFHGFVTEAVKLTPLNGSQIFLNRKFLQATPGDGTFSFNVNKKDTVTFTMLGYKSLQLIIGDTLNGPEYIAGVYLHPDTISIGEVVIMPRLRNLKSDLFRPPRETSTEMENARYNVAMSAYAGKTNSANLGDPASNYEVLRNKQKTEAYEKGGIPSDHMVGLSPFMLIPAAYLLIHGLPEKPAPMKSKLTDSEIKQINKRYLESLRIKE